MPWDLRGMIEVQKALRKLASSQRAKVSAWFFKTGPGQYGEGDKFIGVSNPNSWSVAKKYIDTKPPELKHLLQSPIHEDRLVALMILVEQYRKSKDLKEKKRIVNFYLQMRSRINNWDLVDISSYKILGDYCYTIGDDRILRKLSRSKEHWHKRMAMVSTLAYIRKGETALTYQFAKSFLSETEDLMHKATGWMLREAGKKDAASLRLFIKRYGQKMPRTMLRYAIEKFSPTERKKILISTRVK